MNGSAPKIEILKPLDEAFELMKKILFQPFDLKKWFVIGFTAWLSHIGGGSYNFRYNGGSDWQNTPQYEKFRNIIEQIPMWVLIFGGALLVLLIVALIVIFAWLRSRGQFMFVDCVVKNRGAVVEPWREFQERGNSYFLFSLVVGLMMLVIVGLSALPFLLPLIKGATFAPFDLYLIGSIALWGILLILLIVAWAVISHFMVVIMYRQRCLAVEAFRSAVSLITSFPSSMVLYVLFWTALAIGAAIVSCTAILATCCIALIPYIGTVILLPVFVCLRAYGLLFIRQFGPDYDVWTTISQSAASTSSEPPPLPS